MEVTVFSFEAVSVLYNKLECFGRENIYSQGEKELKKLRNFKKFIEDNFICMNYICLCIVILVSMAIGFFLYGLTIDCLTAFVGMIIISICNALKITIDVNVVSMFSEIISCLVLVVFFACITKYTINKIEISEIE